MFAMLNRMQNAPGVEDKLEMYKQKIEKLTSQYTGTELENK
jgi:hypothetical protein